MITTHVQNLKAFNGAASFVKYWAKSKTKHTDKRETNQFILRIRPVWPRQVNGNDSQHNDRKTVYRARNSD